MASSPLHSLSDLRHNNIKGVTTSPIILYQESKLFYRITLTDTKQRLFVEIFQFGSFKLQFPYISF